MGSHLTNIWSLKESKRPRKIKSKAIDQTSQARIKNKFRNKLKITTMHPKNMRIRKAISLSIRYLLIPKSQSHTGSRKILSRRELWHTNHRSNIFAELREREENLFMSILRRLSVSCRDAQHAPTKLWFNHFSKIIKATFLLM